MKRKGFTLVELLIVIVVIGILSAMMMLSSTESVTSAKASNIISNLRNLKTATLAWYADHIDYVDAAGRVKFNDDGPKPIQEFGDKVIGIGKYMNSESSLKLNTLTGGNKKIPEGEYGVYAVNDTKNPLNGAQNRKTWYVGYHIPEKDSRLKEKLAGRAKSLGLHFTSEYPNTTSDGYYVWLKVMGDWEPESN